MAAIDYLKAFSGNGKRIFIFGDMLELGHSSEELHRIIGEKCQKEELSAELINDFPLDKYWNNSPFVSATL